MAAVLCLLLLYTGNVMAYRLIHFSPDCLLSVNAEIDGDWVELAPGNTDIVNLLGMTGLRIRCANCGYEVRPVVRWGPLRCEDCDSDMFIVEKFLRHMQNENNAAQPGPEQPVSGQKGV